MLIKVREIIPFEEVVKGGPNLGNSYGEIIHDDDIRGMNHAIPKGGPQPENSHEPGQWRARHSGKDKPDVNNPGPVPASKFYTRKPSDGEDYRTLHVIGDPTEDASPPDNENVVLNNARKSLLHVFKSESSPFGMVVPKGGSVCSKCMYLSDDGKHCENKQWQAFEKKKLHKTDHLIPAPADEYCCNVYDWKGGKLKKAIPGISEWKRGKDDPSGRKPRDYVHATPHGTYRFRSGALTFHPKQSGFGASHKFVPLGEHTSTESAVAAANAHHQKLGKTLSAGSARPVSSGGGVFRMEDLERKPKKILYVLKPKDFEKAIFTKDRSDKVKPAPKPSKSGKRGTDSKGRKRYDYSSSGGSKAKLTPGSKPQSQQKQQPVQHPGQHYLEQLAHITRTSPANVASMARRFKTSDEFLRYFKANFGSLAEKHGIQSHHVHHIHDAAAQYAKSETSFIVQL